MTVNLTKWSNGCGVFYYWTSRTELDKSAGLDLSRSSKSHITLRLFFKKNFTPLLWCYSFVFFMHPSIKNEKQMNRKNQKNQPFFWWVHPLKVWFPDQATALVGPVSAGIIWWLKLFSKDMERSLALYTNT